MGSRGADCQFPVTASPELSGRNLYFWCFAPQAIAASDLPSWYFPLRARVSQVAEFPASFTEPLPHGQTGGRYPRRTLGAGAYSHGRIHALPSMVSALNICRTSSSIRDAPTVHSTYRSWMNFRLMTIRPPISGPTLPAPEGVRAIGYDRHVEVRWNPVINPALGRSC